MKAEYPLDNMPEVLRRIIGEMKETRPSFEGLAREADAKLAARQPITGVVYAQAQLPVEIASEASRKVLLLLENNLFYLETLGVLGLTRYLFELLVWLKSIDRDRLRSVEFLLQIHEDQEKHVVRYIRRLNAEADFFDELAKEDGPPAELLETARSDASGLDAEFFRDALARNMDAVDLKARRRFVLYRRAATTNGYGYQALLIRKHAIEAAADELGRLRAGRAEFETRVTRPVLDAETLGNDGKRKRWNWRAEADRVGMADAYDFIYAYTSRLLHATPASFYTSKKNLEMEEMETFLEFCYVTLLDLVELTQKLIRD